MKKLILVLSLLFVPLTQAAEGISYSYLEAAYTYIDPDDFSGTSAGRFTTSGQLWRNLYLFSDSVTDFEDATTTDVGLGWYLPISSRVDVLFEAAYSHIGIDDFDDVSGFRVGSGFRYNVNDHLELGTRFYYQHFGDFVEDSFQAEANALFKVNHWFGINGHFGTDDEGNLLYGGGLRFSF